MEGLAERLLIAAITGAILAIPAAIRNHRAKSKRDRIRKQAAEKGLSVIEYLKTCNVPGNVFLFCEKQRGNEDSLKSLLSDYTNSKYITEAQAAVLFEEYMKAQ